MIDRQVFLLAWEAAGQSSGALLLSSVFPDRLRLTRILVQIIGLPGDVRARSAPSITSYTPPPGSGPGASVMMYGLFQLDLPPRCTSFYLALLYFGAFSRTPRPRQPQPSGKLFVEYLDIRSPSQIAIFVCPWRRDSFLPDQLILGRFWLDVDSSVSSLGVLIPRCAPFLKPPTKNL